MKRLLMGLVPVLFILAVTGCGPVVKDKEMVSISYTGTLADGSVFQESEKDKPLEFLVGAGRMIPTLEKALLGLKTGDKKTVEVKAADAYGEYDQNAVQTVDRKSLPKELELKTGVTYQVRTPRGPMPVTIAAFTDKTVTLDFNHPLAGKDLTFAIQVMKIRDATKEEIAEAFPAAPPVEKQAEPAKK
jgi:FKBP-type peptidyl-prolyl cis-trans isomerase 2